MSISKEYTAQEKKLISKAVSEIEEKHALQINKLRKATLETLDLSILFQIRLFIQDKLKDLKTRATKVVVAETTNWSYNEEDQKMVNILTLQLLSCETEISDRINNILSF